jgi:rsbT co-antagonist protein RsbR
MFGINHDITRRKLSEEKLAQQQQLMRVMIDHIPGSIFVKDAQSRFLVANQLLFNQMNLKSEAEILGKTDFDFHPREFAEQYFADEQALIARGEPLVNHEERVFDQALGEVRWVSTSKIPVRGTNGDITSIVGINYDITERKVAEMAIRDTNEMLEQRVTERTAELSQTHEQLQREMQERREREAENALLQQQIIDAQRLAIQELSTPIIPIVDEVIVMPIVGTVDTHRATDITRALLAGISQYRAKVVILDITGVAIVDTGVANYLNKTIQAARLKGARTIVTGISDAVAETVVDLGIEWHKFETLSNLQVGLRRALAHTGYTLLKQKSPDKTQG